MHFHDLPPLPDADSLLATPAAQGARLLCRHYAQSVEAAVASVGLDTDDGVAARHQVRVALRKLRVTLNGYRPVLADTVSPRMARRSQALARQVGPRRERDVQTALLVAVAQDRTAAQRVALSRLDVMAADDAVAYGPSTNVGNEWLRIAGRLYDATASWTERHHIDTPRASMPLALVAADALEHAADRIARRCAAVRGVDDRKRLHEARLALKSARYLLSPLAASADDGAVMLRAIKEGQSQLGEMLDAHGLRDRVRRTREAIDMTATGAQKQSISALAATERDLTHRVDAAYAQCAAWLQHDTRDALLARLRAIATAWRAAAAPPMEIERKWLLSALPPRLHELMPAALRQGYLPGDTLIERIRSVVRDGETHWFRTVKLGRGMARIEIEEETSAPLGETLFALTEGSRVEKRRYSVQDGMHTWEIDDFTDRALVLAEVELEREDDVVELPVWLAPYVVREVTGEKAFTNWKLAR